MKNALLLLIIFFMSTYSNLSYGNEFFTDTSDYKHYLRIDSDVYDLRTNEKVSFIQNGESKIIEDKLVVKSGANLFIYKDKSSTAVTVVGGEYLSPNWKYKIVVKDNDLYRSDINFETGSFGSLKRITNLGVFNDKLDHRLWRNDNIVFFAENGFYHLNTLTKVISPTPNNIGISKEEYPTPLFINCSYDGNVGFYDVSKNELISFESANSDIWVNTSEFYVIRYENDNVDGEYRLGYNFLDSVNIENRKKVNIGQLGQSTRPYEMTNSMTKIENGKIRALSPNNRAIIFIGYLPPEEFGQMDQRALLFFDLDLLKWSYIEESVESTFSTQMGRMSDQDIVFEWSDNQNIVYATSGNLLEQGTWIFNIKSGEKKKLTTQIANKIIAFRSTNKIIYLARDNKLYESDLEGNDFKELVISGVNINKWTLIQSLL